MCDLDNCSPSTSANIPTIPQAKRRAFLKGLATLPISVVLADPMLAQAAGGKLQPVNTSIAIGSRVSVFLAHPTQTPAPAVLLIHEWWGLNDHIKAMANEFANHGFLALAVDLYDGNVPSTREDAKKPPPIFHWHVAQHAFANPTGGRYDEEDAAFAWPRTLAFFHQHLG